MTSRLVDPLAEREKFMGAANVADKGDKVLFTIGDLAGEFGVTLRTLRFYEAKDLIKPQRAGTTRLYSRRDRARLKLILMGKRVGFSLTDIRELLDLYDQPGGRIRQLHASREKFAEQISKLEKQRQDIEEALQDLRQASGVVDNALAEKENALKAASA